MAIGACIPFAACEFMNSKAYKEMMKKAKNMSLCKCQTSKHQKNQGHETSSN